MNQLQGITSDTSQTQGFYLPNGSLMTMTIYWVPMQQGWFITNLTWTTFVLQGFRISNSPNMLHQYRSQIPFGLACFSTNEREPSLQFDFSSGASGLWLLTEDDVSAYNEFLTGSSA